MKNKKWILLVVLLSIVTILTVVFGMYSFNKKTKIVPVASNIPVKEEPKEEVITKSIKSAKVVALGDNITYGENFQTGNKLWTDLLKERFSLELTNAGVNGNTSTQGLERLKKDALEKNPDFVIINFGLNDHYFVDKNKENVPLDKFKSNLESMIKQIKEKKAIPILVAPNKVIEGNKGNGNMGGNANYYYKKHPANWYNEVGGANAQLKKYCDAIKEIAEKNKVGYVDMYAESEKQELYTMLRSKMNSNLEDGVNLSTEGAKLYAQVIGDYLDANYK